MKEGSEKKRKKQISLVINSNIPRCKPFCVPVVCFPIYVASRIMSRHHCNIEAIIDIIPIDKFIILKMLSISKSYGN